MTSPNWAALVFAWLFTMSCTALLGTAWEWSAYVIFGIAFVWACAWAATVVLYRFLVKKEER